MTETQQAAMRVALEALETPIHEQAFMQRQAAIAALRAALAEPDIDPVDEYRKGFIDGQIDMRDRPAEPVQEPAPVVWMSKADIENPSGWRTVFLHTSAMATENSVPLYTSPSQRKPLTEEEILLISVECAASHQQDDVHFARAVEAAHGIKGGKMTDRIFVDANGGKYINNEPRLHPSQRKPPATIDDMFARMDKAPRGVFSGHDPMTMWMEAWRAAEQHHGIK